MYPNQHGLVPTLARPILENTLDMRELRDKTGAARTLMRKF
jgi:hypothetical protein